MAIIYSDISLDILAENNQLVDNFFGEEKREYGKSKMIQKNTEMKAEDAAQEYIDKKIWNNSVQIF